MNWTRIYLPEAKEDLAKLDKPVQEEVLRGIRKVSQNPEYPNGYGKPLGSHAGSNLAGLYKIKLKKAGIRVVYGLRREAGKMTIIIISARADDFVYREAEKRRKKHDMQHR